MSILSGPAIRALVERTRRNQAEGYPRCCPAIEIDPFDPDRCGPNSYDVTMGNSLLLYKLEPVSDIFLDNGLARTVPIEGLDTRKAHDTISLYIPPSGLVLAPNYLYLAYIRERIRCDGLVPWIDGRSSVGRLGIQIHMTAGRGDDGWDGRFTLEITVVHPVKIYPDMRIGQVTFFVLTGERQPYSGRYQHQKGVVPSRFHESHDYGRKPATSGDNTTTPE